MITHITVEDAAKLISRIARVNEMQALTYIREAADRGEIQTADASEKLQAELEQAKAERDAAVERIREWEKFDTYLFIHNFITPEKWRGQKEG